MGSSQGSSHWLRLCRTETALPGSEAPFTANPVSLLVPRGAISATQCTWGRQVCAVVPCSQERKESTGVEPGKVGGVVVAGGFSFYKYS